MTPLTVHQVAADDTSFAAHLTALSIAQVFATPDEAAAALRDSWLTGHSPAGPTGLDPFLHPQATRDWDIQVRTRLVAATWPNPYAVATIQPARPARTSEQVRMDVAALVRRLRAQHPGIDLIAAADKHPLLDGQVVRRLHDGQQPLDAQTLLDLVEHLRLDVGSNGWIANPTRLRADLARYTQIEAIAASIPVHEYDPVAIHEAMGALATPPHPTSKYRALFDLLDALDGRALAMTFGDVDSVLRSERPRPQTGGAPGGRGGRPEQEGLTKTARTTGWWATTAATSKRAHQHAWTAAGYRATQIKVYRQMARSRVLFVPFDERKWALWGPLRHALRDGTEPMSL